MEVRSGFGKHPHMSNSRKSLINLLYLPLTWPSAFRYGSHIEIIRYRP